MKDSLWKYRRFTRSKKLIYVFLFIWFFIPRYTIFYIFKTPSAFLHTSCLQVSQSLRVMIWNYVYNTFISIYTRPTPVYIYIYIYAILIKVKHKMLAEKIFYLVRKNMNFRCIIQRPIMSQLTFKCVFTYYAISSRFSSLLPITDRKTSLHQYFSR